MKTVFVDVDTQLDFLYPAGALYVPGAEHIVETIGQLNRYAAAHGIPVLSTTDAHAEDDVEFQKWPPHCVAGTLGQHKPAVTLLESRAVIPNSDAPFSIDGAPQIVLEKQTINAFDAPTMARVVAMLGAERFVVYGVVTEICVFNAARGLLAAGKQVVVITDAIRELDAAKGRQAIAEIRERGGTLAALAEACARS